MTEIQNSIEDWVFLSSTSSRKVLENIPSVIKTLRQVLQACSEFIEAMQ